MRYNEVRDNIITATLLTEVCQVVMTEPHLQSLSGESLSHCSAIMEDGTRLDVAMYGLCGARFEKVFIDVRVFNPSTQSNHHGPLSSPWSPIITMVPYHPCIARKEKAIRSAST